MSLSSMPIAISKNRPTDNAHSAVDNLALRISQLVMVNSSNPASVTLKVSETSSPTLSTCADSVLPVSGGA
jgi:hypothetical protein